MINFCPFLVERRVGENFKNYVLFIGVITGRAEDFVCTFFQLPSAQNNSYA